MLVVIVKNTLHSLDIILFANCTITSLMFSHSPEISGMPVEKVSVLCTRIDHIWWIKIKSCNAPMPCGRIKSSAAAQIPNSLADYQYHDYGLKLTAPFYPENRSCFLLPSPMRRYLWVKDQMSGQENIHDRR
jgi:hypothetical protein